MNAAPTAHITGIDEFWFWEVTEPNGTRIVARGLADTQKGAQDRAAEITKQIEQATAKRQLSKA
jgi:hypothetical protein